MACDLEEVARLGGGHADRPAQVVHLRRCIALQAGLGGRREGIGAANSRLRQVDVLDVVGGVVIFDLAAGPVCQIGESNGQSGRGSGNTARCTPSLVTDCFDAEDVALRDRGGWRDVRVPAVVHGRVLLPRELLRVHGEERLGHLKAG